MNDLRYLKPAEAAQKLNVSESTVYRWTVKGDRRGIRLVRVRLGIYGTRYREDWVDRFARGEQVSASETEPQPQLDTKTKPGPRARW